MMTNIVDHLLNIEADCDQPDDNLDVSDEFDGELNCPNDYLIDIGVDCMKSGIWFKDQDTAVKSIENWCKKAYCPLTKRRFRHGESNLTTGKWRPARRDWACCHGIKCNQKTATKRPCQRVLFTGCPVSTRLHLLLRAEQQFSHDLKLLI